MARVKYTEFITSDGIIKFEGVRENNYVEIDFSPDYYKYFKMFDVNGHFDLYVNGDKKFQVKMVDVFELENIPIYKVKIADAWASLIDENLVAKYPDKLTSADIGKYYCREGFSFQYLLCR